MKAREKVAEVIRGMVEGIDLERVMERAGIGTGKTGGAAEVRRLLEGKEGRRQIEARRALARLHVELLALRYGALAMGKVCGLLSQEKPELQLKAALAVLGAMRGEKEQEARSKNQEATAEMARELAVGAAEEGEADMELLSAVAEVLAERRRGVFMARDDSRDEAGHETPRTRGHEDGKMATDGRG